MVTGLVSGARLSSNFHYIIGHDPVAGASTLDAAQPGQATPGELA